MLSDVSDTAPVLELLAGYAIGDEQATRIEVGKGLVGQCAVEKQRILLTKVPRTYTRVASSLGAARPRNIVVLPVLFEGETKAVIELGSLHQFTATHLTFLEQLTQSIGVVLNTIEATMRTENLLQQSQQLTIELQTRQSELQQTNEELASKAKQLAEQNVEVERKNREVEQARRALEEKAAELALTSKYKSEFLANMSHELRTPLNSILILGQQLADNANGNLSTKQVDFARNIHSAGTDLLTLINDILDLSKIESGTVTVEAEELTFSSLRDSVERAFHHLAESKSLLFHVDIEPALPRTFTSDPKRLQQILKNLLSNAFKFTSQGQVAMRVRSVRSGWSADHPVLGRVPGVVAIEVTDTGIGIAPEKQKLIADRDDREVNVLLRMEDLLGDAGVFTFQNLRDLEPLVDHVLVLLHEPAVATESGEARAAVKRQLRMAIERVAAGAEEEKALLRKVIPVIDPTGRGARGQGDALDDDLVYFEDNFGGVGLLPVPLVADAAVNTQVTSVFANTDTDVVQAFIPEGSICRIVCPNSWWFILGFEIVAAIGLGMGVAWLVSADVRVLFDRVWGVPVGWALAQLLLGLSLYTCDTFFRGLRTEVLLGGLVVFGFTAIGWIVRRRRAAAYP